MLFPFQTLVLSVVFLIFRFFLVNIICMEDKPTVFLPLGELKTQEEKVMCLSPHHPRLWGGNKRKYVHTRKK